MTTMTTNLSIQPNPSASSEDQTFHPFPRLPLELRQIIWSHTFIPRVIRFCLSRNPPSWELDPELCTYGASICTPPLTFTINRESRSYALTRYIKISVSDSSPVDRRCWVAPKYAWFNRDIDVLYAVTPTDLLHPQIMYEKRWVKTVMVPFYGINEWLGNYFDLPLRYPIPPTPPDQVPDHRALQRLRLCPSEIPLSELSTMLLAIPKVPIPQIVQIRCGRNPKEACSMHYNYGVAGELEHREVKFDELTEKEIYEQGLWWVAESKEMPLAVIGLLCVEAVFVKSICICTDEQKKLKNSTYYRAIGTAPSWRTFLDMREDSDLEL